MSVNIRRPFDGNLAPVETVATIDTVELFARWLPSGVRAMREQMESVTGERAHITECKDETGFVWGYELIFNRPRKQTVEFASTLVEDSRLGCCWHRDDVAYDFTTKDRKEADALHDWLKNYVELKWRLRSQEKWEEGLGEDGATVYWTRGYTARNLALYMKAPNKVRLELRFRNAGAVKRAGLDDLDRILSLDPSELFYHHMKGEMLPEEYINRIVRKVYKKDIERHLHLRSERHYHDVTDYYRYRIPARVRAMLKRADRPTKKGMKKVDLDWLNIPTSATWL